MAGLSIKCPQCREKMQIRSSRTVSEITTEAFLYCAECGIKAKALAQLQDVEIAEYKPFHPIKNRLRENP